MTERKQETGKRKGETRAEREHERRYRRIRRELARGNMPLLLDAYLASCGQRESEDGTAEGATDATAKGRRVRRRERSLLPNPAGFCRFYGISRDAYGRLESEFPTEVGRMRAVFEDEALNSELSATVLGFYLKFLLGASSSVGEDGEKPPVGDLLVTFEHDILADGR